MGSNHKLCFSGSITIIHFFTLHTLLITYCINEWLVWINWNWNWNWIMIHSIELHAMGNFDIAAGFHLNFKAIFKNNYTLWNNELWLCIKTTPNKIVYSAIFTVKCKYEQIKFQTFWVIHNQKCKKKLTPSIFVPYRKASSRGTYGHDPFEEHRLETTTTDITTALFIL